MEDGCLIKDVGNDEEERSRLPEWTAKGLRFSTLNLFTLHQTLSERSYLSFYHSGERAGHIAPGQGGCQKAETWSDYGGGGI
jgi:hypothetical protein